MGWLSETSLRTILLFFSFSSRIIGFQDQLETTTLKGHINNDFSDTVVH